MRTNAQSCEKDTYEAHVHAPMNANIPKHISTILRPIFFYLDPMMRPNRTPTIYYFSPLCSDPLFLCARLD